jgi:hypothetical protein
MTNKLVLVLSPWALWLNVAEPMFGPYPAFVASRPSHVPLSRPVGFNPGQGQ